MKREAISQALFKHFEALAEDMNPEEVANKLYGIAVLDDSELEHASDSSEPTEERAWALLKLVRRKLQQKPSWFVDICKILRACGVKAITQVIGTNLAAGQISFWSVTKKFKSPTLTSLMKQL